MFGMLLFSYIYSYNNTYNYIYIYKLSFFGGVITTCSTSVLSLVIQEKNNF